MLVLRVVEVARVCPRVYDASSATAQCPHCGRPCRCDAADHFSQRSHTPPFHLSATAASDSNSERKRKNENPVGTGTGAR